MAMAVFLIGISMKNSEEWIWRYKLLDAISAEKNARQILTFKEINTGKSDRFKNIDSSCNILKLDDPMRCHMNRPI